MGTLESVLLGAALAFSLAVPPGPINAMMAATSTTNKWRATQIGFGAMTADAIFLSIVVILHGAVPAFLKPPLAVIGGFLIIYMGARLITQKTETDQENKGGYLSGLFVGISNPYQLGWWVSGGLTMVSIFGYASLAGFFSALLLWVTAFPFTLNKLTERYRETLPKLIKIISALALFIFGIYFLISGISNYV
ncbi:MAG: LysE family transporter [Conexivisphaerales archaeon]